MKRSCAIGILLLLFALPAFAKSPDAGGAAKAPSFTLPTRTGVVSSDSLRGKVVLVDFWASWCGPCRKSFPWLREMYDRYGGRGLEVVAINLDKNRHAAEAFLDKHPAPFTVAFDPSGKSAEAFRVWGMPTGFVVGPSGEILDTYAGFNPKDGDRIEARIEKVIPQ
jgi:cytochrome c biogenesis protein CcmG/thiol:disulfide interchange protein DsbE